MICPVCGTSFHYCCSCSISHNWETTYCSEKCWHASPEYTEVQRRLAEIYMGLHGEGAKQFYACLLDLFETAGVENFVGVEITYKNEGFVINIERRGAADSIVAKMQRYYDAIGYARTSLVVCRDLLQDDGSVDEVIGLLTKATTEIDRLIEPRNTT